MEMREIDVRKVLADVPELVNLEAWGQSGWIEGAKVSVTTDCRWSATHDGRLDFSLLEELRAESLALRTRLGALVLHQPQATRNTSGQGVSGVAVSVTLSVAEKEGVEPKVFRVYVKTRELAKRVCFPSGIVDSRRGFRARARLSLRVSGISLDVVALDEGKCLVLETRDVGMGGDEFIALVFRVRQVLSYLIGEWLSGDSCALQLGADGELIRADWFKGQDRIGNIFHPIPSDWLGWGQARLKLGFADDREPLEEEVLSRVVERFLIEPPLETPISYLLWFSGAPMEMRGALLSVALESLTDVLMRKGLCEYPKLLPVDAWGKLSRAMEALITEYDDGWSKEQRDVIVARLRGLNSPTNAAKLTLPFRALGIELSREDRWAIESRNKLLHQGRILRPEYFRENREAWRQVHEVEMRIYTAVNQLLLTYLEFDGALIDWGSSPIESSDFEYRQVTQRARRNHT
ncbi:hypothetical protein [Myxococcus qinghaiensis]|uniref:hypothetical protein n=1 Tax=Myxococcus qinghaiensis TaxID=2906758 RepID=UPI0020A81397|nr:hypothetical protein [Myxococcus qinghaiensis]MCP3163173.1 hypothetical protein [Myxococcus qinghaiensis]